MSSPNLQRTVNQALRDRAIKHAVYLRRLSNGEARRVAAVVEKMSDEILQKVMMELTKGLRDRTMSSTVFRTKQYRALRERIRLMVKDVVANGYQTSRTSLDSITVFEAAWQKETLRQSVEFVGLGVKSADLAMLRSSVVSRPFQGRVLKHWWRDLGSQYATKLTGALNTGLTLGESVDQIASRVRDTIGVTQRQAHAVMRTAINHVSSHAREETYRANDDLISGVQFVSTLDDRTTLECAALDGKVFPIDSGPRPPIHFNCRSTTVPVLLPAKELGLKDIPLSHRTAMDGRAAGTETYGGWLQGQPEAVQNDVLGHERAELFRSGQVSIDRFVDSQYRPLNLEQLRRREGISQ